MKKVKKSAKKATKKTAKPAKKAPKTIKKVSEQQNSSPEVEATTADNEPAVKAVVDPATGTVVIAPVDSK